MSNDPAVVGGIQMIRTDKFRAMLDALLSLSRKTLPTSVAEMKVALLVKVYQPIMDATTEAAKKLEAKHTLNEAGKVRVTDPFGLNKKRERYNATMLKIKLPKQLLTTDDMPKVGEGVEDVKNREANAIIMSLLGPLFDWKLTAEQQELVADTGVLDEDAVAAFEAIADETPAAEPADASAFVDATS